MREDAATTVNETRHQRQMRLLREIARLRKQVESRRARVRDVVEESRRVCIESRNLVNASDVHLDHINVWRRPVERRREAAATESARPSGSPLPSR
jgi:hypothetical protein